MPIHDIPDFGRSFVPVESLTSSPRSSTGSASVLEWNSNSDSEGFSVRSLDHSHSSPPTPTIPPLSPSPKECLPDPTSPHEDDLLFPSATPAAPIADSASNTVTSDTFVDEYRNLLSALEEMVTLQDSVTHWQDHIYRETEGRLDRPESLQVLPEEDATQDQQHDNMAPSPNRSVATESSISDLTAQPSLHVSSLFLPPAPPAAHVYPPSSPSVASAPSQSESISIAQYFQRKAANPVQPPVDGPLRPTSAASSLSYVSSVQQAPVAVPLPDRNVEVPILHNTWRDLTSKDNTWLDLVSQDHRGSSSTTACPPSTPPAFRLLDPYPIHTQSYQVPTYSPPFGPPPSSQCSDSNMKSPAPANSTWRIPPAMPSQFEAVTPLLTPIKPVVAYSPRLTNIHGRQLSHHYGKTPKSANCQVPPPCVQSPNSPYPSFVSCQLPLPPALPRKVWYVPRTRDIGQASPGSTDSGLPPPPSTPSVSFRWPSRSPSASPISVLPPSLSPSPPLVDLQSGYLHRTTTTDESNGHPSNVTYVSPSPSPVPLTEPYASTQRLPRALPIPSVSRQCGSYSQAPYTPRYTGSTLPRDMHLSAGPPTWGPTPRRLRFAPLPPTPSAGVPYTGNPGSTTLPFTAPLPPYHPLPYPCQPPAPQMPPPASTPHYSTGRPGSLNWATAYVDPHPVFWYSDGSIVFRIGNTGYRVHRHFFERHSVYFRQLLACPAYAITSPTPHTIYLDVKKEDFERLLLIFYPSNLVDPELFTVEEWTSILTLGDKWGFTQLKALATRELGFITSTIEKIALTKTYNMGNPPWLLAAYRELCTRRHPLSLAEADKLGLETTIKIWEVQHELTMGCAWGRSVDNVIQNKFGLEK